MFGPGLVFGSQIVPALKPPHRLEYRRIYIPRVFILSVRKTHYTHFDYGMKEYRFTLHLDVTAKRKFKFGPGSRGLSARQFCYTLMYHVNIQ